MPTAENQSPRVITVPRDAPSTLPSTPQGVWVRRYVEAFNAGDKDAFLNFQEEMFSPSFTSRRPREMRAQMYARLKGDIGTLRILRVVSNDHEISIAVPTQQGDEAIMTFDFEPVAPFKVNGLQVVAGDPGGGTSFSPGRL